MSTEPIESLSIALDRPLHDFVREQAATAGFASPSEYVGELIRMARRHEAEKKLELALLAGLASGPATPMTDQDWEQLRELARQRGARSRGGE
jgi:antitoxin ParD1/3/4